MITGICLAFVTTGNTEEPASRPEIFCTLLVEKNPAVVGEHIAMQVEVSNRSEKTIAVLWPEDTGLLLTWGSLHVTIQNSNGVHYSYVPNPSPFIPADNNHYLKLSPNEKFVREIDVCQFRDDNFSNSVCSKPGRYTINVMYSNKNDTYWDSSHNVFMQVNDVWKGEAKCNQVTLEVVGDQSSEKGK